MSVVSLKRKGLHTSSMGFNVVALSPSVEDLGLNLREMDLRREAMTPRWSSAIDRAAPVSLWFVFTSSRDPTWRRINISLDGEQETHHDFTNDSKQQPGGWPFWPK